MPADISELTDYEDVTDWPSPTPEPVLRARVKSRAAAITRRRVVPVVAVALTVVGVTVFNPAPNGQPVHVRVADDSATDGPEPSDANDGAVDADPEYPSTGLGRPVEEAAERTWGTVASTVPQPPPRPKQDYSNKKLAKKHPLVTDAENDTGYHGHPTLDLTSGDVDMADDNTMAVAMTVRDLAVPLSQSVPGMEPIAVYTAHLEYDGGDLVLEIHRRRDGVFEAFGKYSRTTEHPGGFTSSGGVAVTGLKASVDVDSDSVLLKVDLAKLNADLSYWVDPLAKGSVVVPWFGTGLYSTPGGYWGGTGTTPHGDTAKSDDADFAYRLGD